MLWLNILFPGTGLILRGRLISGACILVLSMLCLTALVLSQLLLVAESAQSISIYLYSYYILASIISSIVLYLLLQKPTLDEQQLRQLHKQASQQYLSEQYDAAVQTAQRICKLAGSVVGSWQLLAMIAEAKGDNKLQQQAKRRAELILTEEE